MLMKTNKWIIILLLFFCQCTKDKMSEEESELRLSISPDACFPEVSDKYIYPVVPGMEEWKWDYNIEDPYEKFCQLPDEVLRSISTPGLIDALIHAPLFTGFYLLSSNASALKWHGHYTQFNSAKELFRRNDAGDALVAYYKLTCFDCVNPPVGVYGDYERMMGLEILFTKQEILDQIGHEKKKEAVASLLAKCEQCPGYSNSIFPMVYLMLADKYDPIVAYSVEHAEEFQCIVDGYFYSYVDQADLMISFAKSFINDKNE